MLPACVCVGVCAAGMKGEGGGKEGSRAGGEDRSPESFMSR